MGKDEIEIAGKVMHIPHLGITLQTLNSVAARDWSKSGGSRYYEIRCKGIHVAKFAAEVPKKKKEN